MSQSHSHSTKKIGATAATLTAVSTGEHYATVGAALLWTLEQRLGRAFTDEVREAWTVVYTLLAPTMQKAATRSRPKL